jgi:hypothetical protein
MQPILAFAPSPPPQPPDQVAETDDSFGNVLELAVAEAARPAAETSLLPALGAQAPVILPVLGTVAFDLADQAMPSLVKPAGDAGPEAIIPATPDVGMAIPRQADARETVRLAGPTVPLTPGLLVAPPAATTPSAMGSTLPKGGTADPALPTEAVAQPALRDPVPAGFVAPRQTEPARGPAQKPVSRMESARAPASDRVGDSPVIPEPSAGRSDAPLAEATPGGSSGNAAARPEGKAPAAPRGNELVASFPAAQPLPVTTPPSFPAPTGAAAAPAPMVVPLSHLPAAVVSALAGGEGIVIDLSPADLGRMRIELPATAGAVEVRLVVEQPDTLPLVRQAAETLADDLRQAGIMAQSVTVELLSSGGSDALRADMPRAEPTATTATASAGGGAGSPQERTGLASSDGGAGSYRGSGGGAGRDGGPAAPNDPVQAAAVDRLDLRL